MPLLDPLMGREQGAAFRHTFEAVYAELEQSPEFMVVGSALGEAYANMFLGRGPVGHMYVYYPASMTNQACPVVVFLHGWLGNLKAYLWAWRPFAEENGFAILAPSFGNGRWSGPWADEMLAWMQSYIQGDPRLDPSRVYVVGLSNGGTGATRWASMLRGTYRGLVYISPVMEGTAGEPAFVAAVGEAPLLVIHGENDSRIPPEYVMQQTEALRRAGLNVTRLGYAGEDHVLVLSARQRLHADLLRWMQAR